jgi:hypothetical protein
MGEMKHAPGPWTLEGGECDPSKPGVYPRWTLWRRWENNTTGMVGAVIVTGGAQTVAYLSANDADAEFIVAACNEYDALREQRDELLKALKGLLSICTLDGESANDSFERRAQAFYSETGLLAPHKDSPAAAGPSREHERAERWMEWHRARIAAASAVIARVEAG